jgi:signal peptidase I
MKQVQAFVWREIREILPMVLIILLLRVVIAEPFYVPTGSMESTIEIGDEVVASKYAYGYSRYSMFFGWGPQSETRLFQKVPERGDVVVFRLPSDPGQNYVKRLIGMPGDRIQMVGGRLMINGELLPVRDDGDASVEFSDGSRVFAFRKIETLPGGKEHLILKLPGDHPFNDTREYVVPPGHLFMMGDDRDNSSDSRVPPNMGGVGYVPFENLVGRGEFVLGSFDFLNAKGGPLGWLSAIRWSRFFSRLK